MEVKNVKSNKPELLVDFNGNAIQAWPLGGITIEVEGGFIARSSLIRITNISSSPAKLRRLHYGVPSSNDFGFPILPQSSEYFACEIGDEFMVQGENLYVTFLRSNADFPPQKVPLGSRLVNISFLGNESSFTQIGSAFGTISGYIDYCYDPSILGHWAEVVIAPVTPTANYPNCIIIVERDNGFVDRFPASKVVDSSTSREFHFKVPITRPGETILIKLDWFGTGLTGDVLTIKVDESTILRNG